MHVRCCDKCRMTFPIDVTVENPNVTRLKQSHQRLFVICQDTEMRQYLVDLCKGCQGDFDKVVSGFIPVC